MISLNWLISELSIWNWTSIYQYIVKINSYFSIFIKTITSVDLDLIYKSNIINLEYFSFVGLSGVSYWNKFQFISFCHQSSRRLNKNLDTKCQFKILVTLCLIPSGKSRLYPSDFYGLSFLTIPIVDAFLDVMQTHRSFITNLL